MMGIKGQCKAVPPGKDLPMYHPNRRAVWLRDQGRCRYCGVGLFNPPYESGWREFPRLSKGPGDPTAWQYQDQFAEIDHIIPLDQGGSNEMDNLALACRPCNRGKGPRRPEEWPYRPEAMTT